MNKKFLAYRGEYFTIEWYYDKNEKSPALDYFEELSEKQKDKLDYLFRLLADSGKIRNEEKFRFEGEQIFAFKPAPDRFLCFFYKDSKVIVTNAYEKKSDKMPPKEKDKALKLKADYEKKDTKKKVTMNKKIKSTYDERVESFSPKRRKEFEEGFRDLALSELILALMEDDEVSVRKLAEMADISPTIIQAMRLPTESKKDFNVKSLFKVLKALGFNELYGKRNGHLVPLDFYKHK